MRVLHVTSEYGANYTGGLGTMVNALVAEQSKSAEVDVFVIRGDRVGFFVDDAERGRNESERGQRTMEEGAFHRYQIIHIHDWHGHWLIDKIPEYRNKVVFTSHLPSIFEGYDKLDDEFESRVNAERKIIERSSYIVANSKFTLSQMFVKHRFPIEKGAMIHNGFSSLNFQPQRCETSLYDAVAAGRLVEQKGLETFVNAVGLVREVLPGAKFAIAGQGELFDQLLERSQELGLSQSLEFLGHLSQEELGDLFGKSTVVAVPSMYEPFGLVATEAMASGACVVASDTGGLREIVEHGHNGLLVEVGDQASLAGAILHLLKNHGARQKLQMRGIQSVSRRFSIARCASNYFKLYKRAINQGK